MKQYTFQVVIQEGSDEFWESFMGKTGCDILLDEITQLFVDEGWTADVSLVEYKDVQ